MNNLNKERTKKVLFRSETLKKSVFYFLFVINLKFSVSSETHYRFYPKSRVM